jgi:hypothetical protein
MITKQQLILGVTTGILTLLLVFHYDKLNSSYWGGKQFYNEKANHEFVCSLGEEIEKNIIKLKVVGNLDYEDQYKLRKFAHEEVYRRSLNSFKADGIEFNKNQENGYRDALLSALKKCGG